MLPHLIHQQPCTKNKQLELQMKIVYRLKVEAHAAIAEFGGRETETDNNKCTR